MNKTTYIITGLIVLLILLAGLGVYKYGQFTIEQEYQTGIKFQNMATEMKLRNNRINQNFSQIEQDEIMIQELSTDIEALYQLTK